MALVPSDLLLLFKTNDCLRHLDNKLGNPVNTAIGEVCLFDFVSFVVELIVSNSWDYVFYTVIAETVADIILTEDLQQALNTLSYSDAGSVVGVCRIFTKWLKMHVKRFVLSMLQWTGVLYGVF
jgi:hypothetical protein